MKARQSPKARALRKDLLSNLFNGIPDYQGSAYKMPSFYGVSFFLSCIYVLGFRRVYTESGDTDWVETGLSVLASVFKFLVASILMISFVSLFDMGDIEKITESGL